MLPHVLPAAFQNSTVRYDLMQKVFQKQFSFVIAFALS